MPVIQGNSSPLYTTSTTVQNILDAVSQDIRSQLSSQVNTGGQPILLDYLNRTQLEMLRASRWQFLLSAPQRFITQLGVTDYWLGTPGQAPPGAYDTLLNLADLRTIKPGTVYDRTNNVPLGRVDEAPLVAKLEYPDASFRMFRPSDWRQSPTSPQVLNIYPAPDNQAIYKPQPMPAICGTMAGGALGSRIYYVTLTYVDSLNNESSSPQVSKIFVPAGSVLVVNPPNPPIIQGTTGIRYDRYNVYVSTNNTQFQQHKQNNSPISYLQAWVEPTSGITTNGALVPSTNNVEPIDGYIIEFRYFKQRVQLNSNTDPSTVIQIPDDYKDVVVSGVNARAYQYLRQGQEAMREFQLFRDGLTQMVRDMNLHPRGQEYLKPDGSSIGGTLPAVETIDLSVLSN